MSLYAKRVICHVCGGPKVNRPRTAYVYCDYCAALTDWDHEIACATAGSVAPGPAYEALLREVGPRLMAARAAGDLVAYERELTLLMRGHLEACPAAYSPRAADPEYRERVVAFNVAVAVANDADPEVRSSTSCLAGVRVRIAALGRPDPFVVPTALFDELFSAERACAEAGFRVIERTGLAAHDPDARSLALLRKMHASHFVQAWLPYLAPADGAGLLRATGLDADYEVAPAAPADGCDCGRCGATLLVPEGARQTICDACGAGLATACGAVGCPGCGAPLALPATANAFACVHCGAEVRVTRSVRVSDETAAIWRR